MESEPVLSSQEVVKKLNKLGFTETRQKRSHKQFKHLDGRTTTVPFHKGKDISPILLRKILKDIHSSIEDFIRL